MRELPVPTNDAQFEELLAYVEKAQRAEAEMQLQHHREELRVRERMAAERRKTVRVALIVIAFLIATLGCWGGIAAGELGADKEKQELSRICIEAGGTWEDRGVDGHTCTSTGSDQPANQPAQEGER